MNGEHVGQVAVIFGGSQGIGKAAAQALAREGAAVVVHGLTLTGAQEVADEILRDGGRASASFGPIEQLETSMAAVDMAIKTYGGLDVLVTSAGIQRYGDVLSTPIEVWDEVFDVNVRGTFTAIQCALPHLRASRAGSIAVVASVQATATQKLVAAYTASKGALVALVRSIAVDEAKYGVRANSVSPGSVDTPMLRAAAADLSESSGVGVSDILRDWGASHPLGRLASAADVGEVVSFLTSTRAAFVTGADVRVDGGLLAQLGAALPNAPAPSASDLIPHTGEGLTP